MHNRCGSAPPGDAHPTCDAKELTMPKFAPELALLPFDSLPHSSVDMEIKVKAGDKRRLVLCAHS